MISTERGKGSATAETAWTRTAVRQIRMRPNEHGICARGAAGAALNGRGKKQVTPERASRNQFISAASCRDFGAQPNRNSRGPPSDGRAYQPQGIALNNRRVRANASAPSLNTDDGPMTPLRPPAQYRLPQRTMSIAPRSNIRLLLFAPKVSAGRRSGHDAAVYASRGQSGPLR